jgi:hypothetical protein
MAHVVFDTKQTDQKLESFGREIFGATTKAIQDAANEILRLSQHEVPHDKGLLQNSGVVEPVDKETVAVGYNKEYAAYQHEGKRKDGSHVIQNYQKGRKGKYLEDPIKNNLDTLLEVVGRSMKIGVTLE